MSDNSSRLRQAELAAAAAAAWQSGLRDAQAGNLLPARRWLERAHRLAPQDPRIELDLATLLLALADAAPAAAIFARIATRHDIAEAWRGLAAACRQAGDAPGAAAACGTHLRRHVLDPAFEPLVAAIAGAAGWCGAGADGALTIMAPGKRITARLDGKPFRPGKTLPAGTQLDVFCDKAPLLGSPLDIRALRRVEGLVAAAPDGLNGWASRPAAPGTIPALTLADAKGAEIRVVFSGQTLPPDDDAPFLSRHEFQIPSDALRGLLPPFSLRGPDGADIFGSPIDPGAIAAIPPVPATRLGKLARHLPARRPLAIVIPVYRGLAVTQACLETLFAAAPPRSRIIVVDDATPEPALAAWLADLAAAGLIHLIRHDRNQGFSAAANVGLREAGRRDVLLLNSDTLVPPGAIATMRDVAYASAETGSVTPLSNEATICSYPNVAGGNQAPDLAETGRLNRLAHGANGLGFVKIPTGIGFCMYLRHDCLAATGGFRGEIFAQGYGEENDWCLRARQRGYRHVAATGAFVAHRGSVSFRAAGRALNLRNAGLLNRLYPGYDAMIGAFVQADPLAGPRRRLDLARFAAAGPADSDAVLLVSHNHGGGVARRVAEDMAAIRDAGQRPILLVPAAPPDPASTPFPWHAQLTDDAVPDYPNLIFKMPAQMPALLRLLRAARVRRVVLHHGLGAHPAIRDIAGLLAVPQHIVIHDYASFCPRVNLVTRHEKSAPLRYCGEPNIAGCIACVKANGDETFEHLGVKKLLRRSAREFAAAAAVTAPSEDAARRIARHFPGVNPAVTPWEDDRQPANLRPPGRGRRKIAVIGGIGPAKGFEILRDCALDAAQRGLQLEFAVAGASAEDERLIDAGIFVTGAYAEGEATGLIRDLRADLAFFPSIWPETWCFALTEAWRAGLYAVAFDLGAQAARIRATGRGALLPLGLPAARINDSLLAWQPDLRNSLSTNKANS